MHSPPNRIACQELEEPDDPGESLVTMSTGVYTGGGASFDMDGEPRGQYSLGVEVSLHFSQLSRSHRADPPLFPFVDTRLWPGRSVALNLGWHLLERELEGPGVGAGYAEIQLFSMSALASGVAAGWAYDPGEQVHGPQFTLFTLGFVYVRVSHMIGHRTDLVFGVQIKVPLSLVWSR